ncbi:hypothetical protein SAMN04488518_102483 [Pseudovibrio ascidiaceicola]|uniref:Uncharacterized protein n=1 Tax=Pseudovibrio ascidiaceicola TaxID=285279 RepID=A0A1I3XB05_9HYPH|nr:MULTISPECIES: hypothetical protein [Pseudovibrio]KZL21947.1 hypothetical protein PsAD37_03467 [Pseudovibrio sp. Ad37]SFK16734.1 hypothetical protein SAMN04488518_102483 [Pseudovibrio ascidiaceicola]
MHVTYIYTEHPQWGSDILRYTNEEVREIFGDELAEELWAGKIILHRGGAYLDMLSAARDKLAAELES